jgi:hypothetical protein
VVVHGGGGCPWFRIHGELVRFCLSFRPNPSGDSAPLHLFRETFPKIPLLPLKTGNVHLSKKQFYIYGPYSQKVFTIERLD